MPKELLMIKIDEYQHILLLDDDATFIGEVDIKMGSYRSLYGSVTCIFVILMFFMHTDCWVLGTPS